MPVVTRRDFARSFGTSAAEINKYCARLIRSKDFRYSVIRGKERDDLILAILKKIREDRQVIGAPARTAVWNKGWKDAARGFVKGGYDLRLLVPKFIRPGQPIRLNGQYVKPMNPDFELDYYAVFRQWLFKKYFRPYRHVYEFGCGTGFNLVALAQLFPEKELTGLDFVPSSLQLLDVIARRSGLRIRSRRFNMLTCDTRVSLDEDSAVFTVGAIEQLAGRINAFMDYLVSQKPSVCIHVEPVIDLYDTNHLFDYLAATFQSKRGYTGNLLGTLRKLESKKRIRLLKVKRLFFGSTMMEGYNCLIWKPERR